MNIVLVDDEKKALNLLKIILERYEGEEELYLQAFSDPGKALEYLLEQKVDLAFLDIEMPGITGLDIAQQLCVRKRGLPEVVFVTAYPQYSMTAWQLEALGYILKPYDPEQIYRMIGKTRILHPGPDTQVTPRIVCFHGFQVYVDGRAVDFRHQKSRELLALLVHHQGGWVPLETIIDALLQNAEEKSSKNYCRIIAYRLKQALEQAGISRIMETAHGRMRILPDLVDCDYYRYLKGDHTMYFEGYLSEYSWAALRDAQIRQELSAETSGI